MINEHNRVVTRYIYIYILIYYYCLPSFHAMNREESYFFTRRLSFVFCSLVVSIGSRVPRSRERARAPRTGRWFAAILVEFSYFSATRLVRPQGYYRTYGLILSTHERIRVRAYTCTYTRGNNRVPATRFPGRRRKGGQGETRRDEMRRGEERRVVSRRPQEEEEEETRTNDD